MVIFVSKKDAVGCLYCANNPVPSQNCVGSNGVCTCTTVGTSYGMCLSKTGPTCTLSQKATPASEIIDGNYCMLAQSVDYATNKCPAITPSPSSFSAGSTNAIAMALIAALFVAIFAI